MDSRYFSRPAQETALPRGLLEAVFWEQDQDLDLCWLPAWHRQHPHSAQPAPAATAPLLLSGKHPGEGRGPPATSPDLRPIFNKSLPGLISSPARGRAATCWARGAGLGRGWQRRCPSSSPPRDFGARSRGTGSTGPRLCPCWRQQPHGHSPTARGPSQRPGCPPGTSGWRARERVLLSPCAPPGIITEHVIGFQEESKPRSSSASLPKQFSPFQEQR